MKHSIFYSLLIVVVLAVLPMAVHAQPQPENPDVPIDGGLSLLLAAGIGYGAKKAYDARKKYKQTEEK